MKIAYSWLKEYVDVDLSAEKTGEILTDIGLEVETIETVEQVKGGLKGLVIGQVKTKIKHPEADRLSITTVDIGTGTDLTIVCGATNVAAEQKVVVATVGATIYPVNSEPVVIKKSKIRGQLSEGMICAEDEIGLGTSHEGIMVLNEDAAPGTPASVYFKIQTEEVFEIGLTPNRADAASHIGVARDLIARLHVLSLSKEIQRNLKWPDVDHFATDNHQYAINVEIQDTQACPRYSGVTIQNIKVADSPEWLKNRLKSIGVRSINNVVDISNFVLHELGQPLHVFDANKIKGNKVIVKKLKEGTKFTTLDGIERTLSADDLMICNAEDPMCIAGVFGGAKSGVTADTTAIFLESAYFNSVSIRKSSKKHGLKTDASFRFERGTDPNITVYALKRAALLIKEIAGGEISSDIIDIYPKKTENFKVAFAYSNCTSLIGKQIEVETIRAILKDLDIEVVEEGHDALLLSIPPFRVDVTREQDVIEEILRIYGYNNIEIPSHIHSSLLYSEKPDKEKIQQLISEFLSNNGYSEIMNLSLTKSAYTKDLDSLKNENNVFVLNPLSSDLDALRQTLLFGGLETIVYNQNRKQQDLKLYEFGKTYKAIKNEQGISYFETKCLSLFLTGNKNESNWNIKNELVNFYTLKGAVTGIFNRLGLAYSLKEYHDDLIAQGLSLSCNKKSCAAFGYVSTVILKQMDIKQEVFYASINWDFILEAVNAKKQLLFSEVPKFPEVKRDLALLIDKSVQFEQLEKLAYQAERNFLKHVNLFDVYEGDKLPKEKKSYAMSFTLQNEEATLTDSQIEKIMEKLIKVYRDNAGAEIR